MSTSWAAQLQCWLARSHRSDSLSELLILPLAEKLQAWHGQSVTLLLLLHKESRALRKQKSLMWRNMSARLTMLECRCYPTIFICSLNITFPQCSTSLCIFYCSVYAVFNILWLLDQTEMAGHMSDKTDSAAEQDFILAAVQKNYMMTSLNCSLLHRSLEYCNPCGSDVQWLLILEVNPYIAVSPCHLVFLDCQVCLELSPRVHLYNCHEILDCRLLLLTTRIILSALFYLQELAAFRLQKFCSARRHNTSCKTSELLRPLLEFLDSMSCTILSLQVCIVILLHSLQAFSLQDISETPSCHDKKQTIIQTVQQTSFVSSKGHHNVVAGKSYINLTLGCCHWTSGHTLVISAGTLKVGNSELYTPIDCRMLSRTRKKINHPGIRAEELELKFSS